MDIPASEQPRLTHLPLKIGGVAPNTIRELSGIYPTFVEAFKELVSNAYDADASQVTIRLAPDLSTVTVEDDGLGMTPFEFQNDYIRIGGSIQRNYEDLTPGGRRPIGRKGIGFLAVARYCWMVEVRSRANRAITYTENLKLEPQPGKPQVGRFSFFQGPLAQSLAPFTTVQAVRCGTTELPLSDYVQDGNVIKLSAEVWRRFAGHTLSVQYTVDCHAIELQATIDYDYLLGLEDDRNLATVEDFCQFRLIPASDARTQSFTHVMLHLRGFVRRELQAPQRRGRVRNVASASGLDRFLWQLSRSAPVSYDLDPQELGQQGLEILVPPPSPTPFTIKLVDAEGKTHHIRRPLWGQMSDDETEASILVRQPVTIETDSLTAHGYLLGFSQLIFPAELRGIAVRVRGVEIGTPSFLGVENELPIKLRPFLGQVMGEIIVTQGLDAISAITPGRAGFYAENGQFLTLHHQLVGDGAANWGALGQVLESLRERATIESSAARIVQEAKRRREAFLDVSQALTALSISSRYGRALRCMFSRSGIAANGLADVPEYQLQLPNAAGDYVFELSDSVEGDYELDSEHAIVRFNRSADMWNVSLYVLGRDWAISLRNGKADDPVCEIDLTTNTIYLNWMHPTRTQMGDAMFVKSALSWRIAYLAANGDVDLMMNLAHRLLSFTS